MAPEPSALACRASCHRGQREVSVLLLRVTDVRRWEGGDLQWEAEVSDATPSAEASDSKDHQIDWPLPPPSLRVAISTSLIRSNTNENTTNDQIMCVYAVIGYWVRMAEIHPNEK